MDLAQLNFKTATAALAARAFWRGTTVNHVRQADSFIRFCDNYKLDFINPATSILCYSITHFTFILTSSKSVRNYVSDTFWTYVTSPCVPQSPVATALAECLSSTSHQFSSGTTPPPPSLHFSSTSTHQQDLTVIG